MTQQLRLKPIIKEMLVHAGIEDGYDFAPSAKDCACPIVIANETYERTDLLDDCEYGIVKLDVIAVHETRGEVLRAISDVLYALHQADWARYDNEVAIMRAMEVIGLPGKCRIDRSGRISSRSHISLEVSINSS